MECNVDKCSDGAVPKSGITVTDGGACTETLLSGSELRSRGAAGDTDT